MTLIVDAVEIEGFSTLGVGVGTDVDTGERVRFAGDWRPMYEVGKAVALHARGVADELPRVDVEPWQVIGRG